MSTHKSSDYKLTAVKYFLYNNVSQLDTCKIFNCNPRSLMRWVNKYKTTNTIKRKNRTYKSYKVNKQQVDYIIQTINNDKTITMKDLLYKIKLKYPEFNISERHLLRIVNDNNITLKQTRFRHEPNKRYGKTINIKDKLKSFYETIEKYKIEDIICIDETSLKTFDKRKHCYSELGKRCIIKTHSQEVFKKYTGIFAINYKGVIGYKIYQKDGINSDRLIEFLEENISNLKNKLIILDNASSHRNELVKKLIDKDNKLLYSVPYQHFTNSIENYFSMLKARLYKKNILSYEKLVENIDKVIKSIPSINYKNIITSAYKRNSNYIKTKTRKKELKNYK